MTKDDYWTDEDGTAHYKVRLLVFIGNNFLGESEIDPGNCPEMGWRGNGVVYFCPFCGEIWARVVMLHKNGRDWPFEIAQVSCENHPDHWETPGSLLGGCRNEHYLPYLPLDALKREFMIHLNHYLKEI